jgi:DNA-binding NtrC family response regulator
LLNALAGSGGEDNDVLVKRLVQTLGLAGLALFAPMQQAISRHAAAVADVVSILQCCQMADEETRVLEELCSRLKTRLRAAGASFLIEEAGRFAPVAADGAGFEASLAQRAAALDHPIAPHQLNGRVVAGASVRYGGRSLGVLLVRWGLGGAYDPPEAAVLLATAATAAGPAMAGVVARRASAAAPRIPELIGLSALMVDVRRAIERSAAAPFAVLVEGESGTGKELVARAIHRQSTRRDRPFSTLNCAALPDDLVESELFGHSRGAFTGALAERTGVFEEAHTGTLFLDEIGELSPRAQAKVLRTVQEGELRRVGENMSRRIDVRLVAATNRDLRQEVAAGRFRLDLLYRLDVIRISLPPLRARRDDIQILAEHFWRDAAARIGSRATLSTATLAELARYDWPGNVRELQNVLAALAVRTPRRGLVPPSALPSNFGAVETRLSSRLDAARRIFDTQFVRAALARAGGHRIRAAQELGVTRQGLTKLMNRLGLNERPSPQP